MDSGNPVHYKVSKNPQGRLQFANGSRTFADLSELVEFHKQTMDDNTLVCVLVNTFAKANRTVVYGSSPEDDAKWEIDVNTLNLGTKLGAGQYGEVWKGDWQSPNGPMTVAVKTFKRSTMDPQEFLKEADIMKKMQHDNLVNLIGVVTKQQPLLIVTEFMPRGDLLAFLRDETSCKEIKDTKVGEANPGMMYIASQISKGMAFLESHNFIHR